MAAVAQSRPRLEPASIPAGLRAILPVLPAAFVFGASFGLLAGSADVGGAATTVMSLTTFAGSAQFAAVAALKEGGGGLLAGIVAAVFLNLRYLPIGLSVAEAVPGSWWQRLCRAQLVVDESWALGQVAPGRWAAGRLLGAGLGLFAAWNLGTLVGSLGGSIIGDPEPARGSTRPSRRCSRRCWRASCGTAPAGSRPSAACGSSPRPVR